ncbi:MAG: DUF3667 domain-containing protein [Dysgonomonas sp.]
MSKHKVRHSKSCLNCGSFVEKHYCPNCGQENSESRQSFHHLFTHFISDFIHYDGAFLRTTKLLFRYPGRLSIEYMNGKRKSYVNPFSYYIFISFITFLIPSFLPEIPESYNKGEKMTNVIIKEKKASSAPTEMTIDEEEGDFIDLVTSDSVTAKKVDKWYKSRSVEKQVIKPKGVFYETALTIIENANDKDRAEKALEFFLHNLSKVLFIYMPIFAFWLWIFHNKKGKYYFDSGIFTLHFFSVLLLSITICQILSCLFDWLHWGSYSIWLWMFMFLYITFYFFRGSRVFYGERRIVSHPKSFILIGINNFFISVILLLYGIFTIVKVYA